MSAGRPVSVSFRVLACVLLVASARAQRDKWALEWTTVSGGSGLLAFPAGETLEVNASIGQPVAGRLGLTTGTTLEVGFLANPKVQPLQSKPLFRFGAASYQVQESNSLGFAEVVVEKNFSTEMTVGVFTKPGTAQPRRGRYDGDYMTVSTNVLFKARELRKLVRVSIVDDFATEPNEFFEVALDLAAASPRAPHATIVTIVDDDVSGSQLGPVLPGTLPPLLTLTVFLDPPSAIGRQWRLPGEHYWRNSGEGVAGLPAGNYELEFRPIAGYQTPQTEPIPLQNDQSVRYAYRHTPDISVGSLKVTISNPELAGHGALWRLQGELDSQWHANGHVIWNLPVGRHIIEFNSVSSELHLAPPSPRIIVLPELTQTTLEITVAYLLPDPSPESKAVVVRLDSILDDNRYPFRYMGQVRSALGFGSGFAVRPRVVLTAAHVLFDDDVYGYESEAQWLFQQSGDDFHPELIVPRGWYVFTAYSIKRQEEDTPGRSSVAAYHYDVAAMFFGQSAGRNGYGEYLVNDETHAWLLAPPRRRMVLLGYPMQGVDRSARGNLHMTAEAEVLFHRANNSDAYAVYATTSLWARNGTSGGPLCVLATSSDTGFPGNRFIPAAIYVGGDAQDTGRALVRAIDADVVELIELAENSAETGDNGNSEDKTRWRTAVLNRADGRVVVTMGPLGALPAGAGWRLANGKEWITDAGDFRDQPGGLQRTLVFKDVQGYEVCREPSGLSVKFEEGKTNFVYALYCQPGEGGLAVRLLAAPRMAPSTAGWRLEPGQQSNITNELAVIALPAGHNYSVKFNPVPDYVSPKDADVRISEGQVVLIEGEYLAQSQPQPIPISIRRVDSDIVVEWKADKAVLQATTDLGSGVWVELPEQSSPARLPTGSRTLFVRLKLHSSP